MNDTKPAPAILEEQHLLYLDALQESHVTSMFGAGPYLEAEFDLTRREAADVMVHWMRTFADRHPDRCAVDSAARGRPARTPVTHCL